MMLPVFVREYETALKFGIASLVLLIMLGVAYALYSKQSNAPGAPVATDTSTTTSTATATHELTAAERMDAMERFAAESSTTVGSRADREAAMQQFANSN